MMPLLALLVIALTGPSAPGEPPRLARDADGRLVVSAFPADTRCRTMMLQLHLDDSARRPIQRMGSTTLCSNDAKLRPGENLVIEALDTGGNQLWITFTDDARASDAVLGRPPRTTLDTSIYVPSDEGVASLRWYEVSEADVLRLIGETSWRPIAR